MKIGTAIWVCLLLSFFFGTSAKAESITSPDGQLKLNFSVNAQGEPVYELSYKGKEVRFKVIEYNPKTNRIIGSIKQIADEEKKVKTDEFWNNVEVGKTYTGTVNSISEYGAFIDIDGIVQGLLHISEMTWERDKKPKDILEVGQEVKVKIKEVDKENKRIKIFSTSTSKNIIYKQRNKTIIHRNCSRRKKE